MGSLNLAYPKRMGGTAQEQISALYRSQCEIIDWLNLSDWSAEAVLQEIAQGIDDLLADREIGKVDSGNLQALVLGGYGKVWLGNNARGLNMGSHRYLSVDARGDSLRRKGSRS